MTMAYIDWCPSYSVHNSLLDEQHQQLFTIINELYNARYQKKSREQMIVAIRQLVEYTQKHFAEEERQMELIGFTGLAEHKAAHEKLTQKVIEIEQQFHDARDGMVGDLLGFLVSDWLLKHILDMDKQYVPYLKSVG